MVELSTHSAVDSQAPPTRKGTVQLWVLDLDLPEAELTELGSILSPLEQDRASRFHFDLHRNRYIAAHGWLRRILSGYLSLAPEVLEFNFASRGKPMLAGSAAQVGLEFNLSHSQSVGLLGVAQGMPIGVDVEEVRALKDAQELVARFFSRNESALFESLPEAGKPAAFFNLWTRKEAWLKATGEGIAHLLAELEVSFLPGNTPRIITLPKHYASTQPWSLSEVRPRRGFVGAVAVPASKVQLEIRSSRQFGSLAL